MKAAKNKLHNRRGVSILLAMVMFLIASMVSIVIITAALTTAKRVQNDIVEEQNHLAVTSAAQLLGDYLKESSCKITDVRTENTGGTETSRNVDYAGTGKLSSAIEAAVKELYADGRDESTVYNVTLSPGTNFPSDYPDAKYSFTMKRKDSDTSDDIYRILGYVSVEKDGKALHKLFLTIYASVTEWPEDYDEIIDDSDPENPETIGYTITKTTDINWSNVTISTSGTEYE